MNDLAEDGRWEPSPAADDDLTDECWYGWCDHCSSPACTHACHDPNAPQPGALITWPVRDGLL